MFIGTNKESTTLHRPAGDQINRHTSTTTEERIVKPQSHLAMPVIRLLAIALKVTADNPQPLEGNQLRIPPDYRSWPVLSSKLGGGGVHRSVRFYLNPKAASTSGSQPFPAGSTFVVETFRLGQDGCRDAPDSQGMRSDVLFIMTKCATVLNSGTGADDAEVWLHANYDGEGRPLGIGWSLCHVCSVPGVRASRRNDVCCLQRSQSGR